MFESRYDIKPNPKSEKKKTRMSRTSQSIELKRLIDYELRNMEDEYSISHDNKNNVSHVSYNPIKDVVYIRTKTGKEAEILPDGTIKIY